MKNFVQPGHVLTFVAPAGGVVTGVAVLIGATVVVPSVTAAEGADFEGAIEGVFELIKAAGAAWDQGAPVYFDSADGKFKDATSATARRAGIAAAAALAADVVGLVLLKNIGAAVNVA